METNHHEPRTAEDRANFIITHLRDAHVGFPKVIQEDMDMIIDQIQQAMDEARAEGYAQGKVDGMEVKALMGKGLNEAFLEGQAAMRERAAKVFEEWCPTTYSDNYIYQKIRALPLSEAEGGKSE